jgi:hypothetical protein
MKGIAIREHFGCFGSNVYVWHVYHRLTDIYPKYEEISKLKAVLYFDESDDLKFIFK